ncbi:MAG: hypothetical protein ACERLB_16745, partial [Gammaproteobacteria bacterium]
TPLTEAGLGGLPLYKEPQYSPVSTPELLRRFSSSATAGSAPRADTANRSLLNFVISILEYLQEFLFHVGCHAAFKIH